MKLIRKLTVVLFCALLSIGMVLPTYAEESKVTYVGKAENFIFSPGTKDAPTNLFPNFQNVIPGDTITQQIVVKNKENKKVKIYLRSLGAKEGSEEFLSQLKLTVKPEGSSKKYTGPADESGDLSKWVCLGTLSPNAEIKLNVTLEVPITMGNEFQDQAGYLDWEFMVEEIEADGTTSQTGNDKVDSQSKNPVVNLLNPKTGDNAKIILYGLLMGGALIVFIVLFVKKRKNR